MHPSQLTQLLGNIDIYLLDQILKGRLMPKMRVLDAGCGSGRNHEYLLKTGFDVFGIDQSPEAIEYLHNKISQVFPDLLLTQFAVGDVAQMPYPNAHFDWVISSAVLHFAKNAAHFEAMVAEMMRVLKPTGVLFARLASDIGIGSLITPLENGWYHLPDGSSRFLVTELQLIEMTQKMDAHFIEPIKTTNVQNLRAMTTWVIQKNI
ncbi:class I SAM-dependent methyltransferase [uncultured Microscilla sp.]|uniref:class I SAM-dependent methyltransferase n=1 Tax=uncultured Microscilla sp. TaxID=432653 RepID=UPI00262EE0ED|nr:class I SAM-dependent methyltransferase [uncultured Microscilla sp.]